MPDFALDLGHQGIRLLHRQEGGWTEIASVSLDDPDLAGRLAAMRDEAEALGGGGFETELVIPGSQILYTEVSFADGRTRIRDADIAEALDGRTACPPDEMVFDWRRDGEVIRVAVLEITTLDEAESFAAGYGFNPVSFTARPEPHQFPDTPDFGLTTFARLRDAEDGQPLPEPVFASRRLPEAEPVENLFVEAPTPEPAPEPGPAPATAPEGGERPVRLARALAAPLPAERSAGRAASQAEALTRFGARTGAAAEGAMSPALFAAVAAILLVAAGLVWTAYYLVTPREGRELPTLAFTPESAEEALAEARLPVAEAPVRAPSAPAEPATAQAPAPGPGAPAAEMRARAVALFAPDPEAMREPETEPLFAADTWQTPPPAPRDPPPTNISEVYLASIDPVVVASDAVALAEPRADTLPENRPASPPPAERAFAFDDRGLVVATPQGSLTPAGILVVAGRPPLEPRPRPASEAPPAVTPEAEALAAIRPRARPGDLAEEFERSRLGGRTRAELATFRPRPRPASAQEAAVAVARADAPAASALAVASSIAPRTRPEGFDALAAAVLAARTRAAEERALAAAAPAAPESTPAAPADTAAVAPAPDIPTSASVARNATISNAINLRRLNLIGVYGSDNDKRALIRLPSGRYVKVKVGDSVDGGRVAAIGDDRLQYVKGGRNVVLVVPSG